MNSTMKTPFNITPGTTIIGKWYKHSYKIVRKLGAGANGTVYLAEFNQKFVALKISDNHANIASEMNVLKSLSKVQGSSLGPSLFHGDDWIKGENCIPFYVMEYIEGKELLDFVRAKGEGWIEILMLQLLSDLGELHNKGWIFGDLKPENLIVTSPAQKIRCVDMGGTTVIGRSVKEFTEFFDRGYWGQGSRKAEPTYDLFAVAMIFINVYYPNRFSKQKNSPNQLLEVIQTTIGLVPYQNILEKAIRGKYATAKEMRMSLLNQIQSNGTNTFKNVKAKPTSSRNVYKKKRKKGGLKETVFILILVCCLYGLYLYAQIIG